MLLERLRNKSREESGFTLVELLVVMLILGILAAIAIPAFFNQRDKAKNSEAKANARTAQTAMETCYTDKGTYAGCTLVAGVGTLATIEPTLLNQPVTASAQSATAYTITATSTASATPAPTYGIARTSGGVTYPCGAGQSDCSGTPLSWKP